MTSEKVSFRIINNGGLFDPRSAMSIDKLELPDKSCPFGYPIIVINKRV